MAYLRKCLSQISNTLNMCLRVLARYCQLLEGPGRVRKKSMRTVSVKFQSRLEIFNPVSLFVFNLDRKFQSRVFYSTGLLRPCTEKGFDRLIFNPRSIAPKFFTSSNFRDQILLQSPGPLGMTIDLSIPSYSRDTSS